jgi:anti-anti-sigma factor
MTAPLKVDTIMQAEGIGLVAVAGDVNLANAQDMKDAALKLVAQGARHLVVDLSKTVYLDSAGIGVLKGLLARLKERGGVLAVAGATGRVRYVIGVAHLEQAFTLCDTVTAALEEIGKASKEAGQ